MNLSITLGMLAALAAGLFATRRVLDAPPSVTLLGPRSSAGSGRPSRASDLGIVLRRHRLAVLRLGGGLLVVIGLAMVSGVWGTVTSLLQSWISGYTTVV